MYAPVFLPQAARPSAEVLAAEAAILASEGPFHVEGRYYANPGDADRQRRWAAQRIVREVARRAAYAPDENAAGDWRSRWRRAAVQAAAPSLPRVVTWLPPRDRDRLTLALDGHAGLVHHDSLDALRVELIDDTADAVLISAGQVRLCHITQVARLVLEFPGVPVLGIAGEASDSEALTGSLLLGRAGVSAVFDCASALGLAALRTSLAPRSIPDAFERSCVASVLSAVDSEREGDEVNHRCPAGLARFFATVFASAAATGKQVAASLGVHPSTLVSRFHRAGLPTVRQYVACARLVLAARLGETPGLSLSAIAHRLDASSPQSFNRGVRTLTGMSAMQFRRAFTGAAMLDRYRATLIIPHRDTLRCFDPTGIESRRVGGGVAPDAIFGRAA